MAKDLREILKNIKDEDVALSQNHSKNFENLLVLKMHQKSSKKKKWLKITSIAATVTLVLSVCSWHFFKNNLDEIPKSTKNNPITLGNISPEFNNLETYYINSINLEISKIDFNENNTDIVDGYLLKIAELTNEYKLLTQELNIKGVNNTTIDALIRNLQLRLQLLQQLQKQLSQFKNLNTKNHEQQVL